jgi:hypothetical protein
MGTVTMEDQGQCGGGSAGLPEEPPLVFGQPVLLDQLASV